MAEPPNALTNLLRGKTLEEIYEILHSEKSLSAAGIEGRAQVIAVAANAEAHWHRDQQALRIGGTREYCIALALVEGRYLNRRGKKLLNTVTIELKHWWKFWSRLR